MIYIYIYILLYAALHLLYKNDRKNRLFLVLDFATELLCPMVSYNKTLIT